MFFYRSMMISFRHFIKNLLISNYIINLWSPNVIAMIGKKVIFFLFICIALSFNACNRRSKNTFVPKGESYVSFVDNGAWCWFSDPRAIYFKGQHRRTYAGWVDSSGNIAVGFYDYDLKRIETNVLHKNVERDDHSNPSLFIDRAGKLKVFYSKHASSEPIYLLKAKNPEDISEWEIPDTLKLMIPLHIPGFRTLIPIQTFVS